MPKASIRTLLKMLWNDDAEQMSFEKIAENSGVSKKDIEELKKAQDSEYSKSLAKKLFESGRTKNKKEKESLKQQVAIEIEQQTLEETKNVKQNSEIKENIRED